jgi:hypothetical protein
MLITMNAENPQKASTLAVQSEITLRRDNDAEDRRGRAIMEKAPRIPRKRKTLSTPMDPTAELRGAAVSRRSGVDRIVRPCGLRSRCRLLTPLSPNIRSLAILKIGIRKA